MTQSRRDDAGVMRWVLTTTKVTWSTKFVTVGNKMQAQIKFSGTRQGHVRVNMGGVQFQLWPLRVQAFRSMSSSWLRTFLLISQARDGSAVSVPALLYPTLDFDSLEMGGDRLRSGLTVCLTWGVPALLSSHPTER